MRHFLAPHRSPFAPPAQHAYPRGPPGGAKGSSAPPPRRGPGRPPLVARQVPELLPPTGAAAGIHSPGDVAESTESAQETDKTTAPSASRGEYHLMPPSLKVIARSMYHQWDIHGVHLGFKSKKIVFENFQSDFGFKGGYSTMAALLQEEDAAFASGRGLQTRPDIAREMAEVRHSCKHASDALSSTRFLLPPVSTA